MKLLDLDPRALWKKAFRAGAFGLVIGSVGLSAFGSEMHAGPSFGPAGAPERSMQAWVNAFQQGPQQHSFKGVFVVSIPQVASLASSRILHWAQEGRVVERIEALQGDERVTLREGQHVVAVLPAEKKVRIEELQRLDWTAPAALPLKASPHYQVVSGAQMRVAGIDAYVVEFRALDDWRLSYRIWSDAQRGLILKMQLLSASGKVLEQREFLEISFDVPQVSLKEFRAQMKRVPEGFRVLKSKLTKVAPESQGWHWKEGPIGFELVQCFQRADVPAVRWMQCVFSDGMTSVSVFMEQASEGMKRRERNAALGSTHTMTTRYQHEGDAWWLTAVGEVPLKTLKALTESVERVVIKK